MKTVLVNRPIHTVALERLREEVRVLTPYDAGYEQVLDILAEVHGLILCAGLDMGTVEMDRAGRLEEVENHARPP